MGCRGRGSPKQYRDTYREDLMKRINEKVRNKETHTLTEPEKEAKPRKSAEVIDLMDILKQSLAKGGQAAAGRTEPRRTPRKAGGHAQPLRPRPRRKPSLCAPVSSWRTVKPMRVAWPECATEAR